MVRESLNISEASRHLRTQCWNWSEDQKHLAGVIDLLARLDGIDFRQTAP
jgi:hypothetical protein